MIITFFCSLIGVGLLLQLMISIHVIFQRLLAVHHLVALGAGVAEDALEVDALHMVPQLDPALMRKVLTD